MELGSSFDQIIWKSDKINIFIDPIVKMCIYELQYLNMELTNGFLQGLHRRVLYLKKKKIRWDALIIWSIKVKSMQPKQYIEYICAQSKIIYYIYTYTYNIYTYTWLDKTRKRNGREEKRDLCCQVLVKSKV